MHIKHKDTQPMSIVGTRDHSPRSHKEEKKAGEAEVKP